MKKTICILGCVIALMLTGCQTQHDPSMDTDQIFPSGSSNTGVPSASNPVNTDTGSDQANGKDNPNTNTPSEDDSANTPTQSAPIRAALQDQVTYLLRSIQRTSIPQCLKIAPYMK